jgi:hypothetical protein
MKALSLLNVLLSAASVAGIALPASRPTLEDDDTDDTPLPLVIWHGTHKPSYTEPEMVGRI